MSATARIGEPVQLWRPSENRWVPGTIFEVDDLDVATVAFVDGNAMNSAANIPKLEAGESPAEALRWRALT
jgi:hypothetical protein